MKMGDLMNASLKALLNEQYKLVAELREENKKLKEKLSEITMVADDEKQSIEHILELEQENKKLNEKVKFLEECLDRKEEVNKKMREEIKDHQLYEEKLEHRIIELEELLHGE